MMIIIFWEMIIINTSIVACVFVCRGNVCTEPLPSNDRLLWLHYSVFQASCHNIIYRKVYFMSVGLRTQRCIGFSCWRRIRTIQHLLLCTEPLEPDHRIVIVSACGDRVKRETCHEGEPP
jgi:hypothetical protein